LGKSVKTIEKIPLLISCFLVNFWTGHARKSIKGSEDSYLSQKSNKTLICKVRMLDLRITSYE